MKNGADDAEIRTKSSEVQRLLATHVDKLERLSGDQQQTNAAAFRDLVDSYKRWLAVEDDAASLLRGLLANNSSNS
jgi:hypothetical protein